MTDLLFIHWNPDPVAFSILGREIRWYGLCWCAGLLLGYLVMQRLYRQQGIPKEKFEPLFLYVFVGVLAGARLGHCLFYEPGYFLTHPLQMILPMKETFEGWRCTGYEGLSSHGGVFGMFVSLWLYIRKYKVNAMRVLDNMGICAPLTACFIRLGNLFNSEIVGKTTDMPWGFVFAANGDTLARHPGQLYESLAYIAVFFIGRTGKRWARDSSSAGALRRYSRSASSSSSSRKCRRSSKTPYSSTWDRYSAFPL